MQIIHQLLHAARAGRGTCLAFRHPSSSPKRLENSSTRADVSAAHLLTLSRFTHGQMTTIYLAFLADCHPATRQTAFPKYSRQRWFMDQHVRILRCSGD